MDRNKRSLVYHLRLILLRKILEQTIELERRFDENPERAMEEMEKEIYRPFAAIPELGELTYQSRYLNTDSLKKLFEMAIRLDAVPADAKIIHQGKQTVMAWRGVSYTFHF
ncbi:hypothetical protein EDM68_01405 [Candidatus Uhrbacteria bacterium]|nr:MAG: hypothetical protein EDM68_01405 [Candidatus Uhrbacteria bacterium]